MATRKVSEVLLRYSIDKAASAATQNELKKINSLLAQNSAASDKAAAVAAQTGKAVKDAFGGSAQSNVDAVTKKIENQTAKSETLLSKLQAVQAQLKANAEIPDPSAGSLTGEVGSGLFGRGGAIARVGREVKALPAIPIPGTGLSTDALAKITSLLGTLGPAAVAAAAGVAVLVVGVVALNKITEESKKKLDAATTANKAYYDLLGSGATTKDAKSRLEELKKVQAAQQQELGNITQGFAAAQQGAKEAYGNVAGTILSTLTQISNADDKLTGRADELRTSTAANEAEINRLTQAIDEQGFSANDAAEAAKELAEAEKKLAEARFKVAQAGIDAEVNTRQKIRELIRDGSREQLDDAKQSIQDQIEQNQDKINKERDYQKTLKLGTEQYDAVTAKIRELEDENTNLINSMASLSSETIKTIVTENDLAKFREQQNKDTAAAVQKYNDDVVKLEERANEQRAALQQRYNDALIKAAETAARAAEDALDKLQQKRDDLALNFGRNAASQQQKFEFEQLESQIKFQENEAKAARDHARDLQQIREDAAAEEFDLILNRDFAGLFKQRQQTTRRINDAERQYQEERQERLQSYQEQNAAAARQYVFEQQQRQIKYQQDLTDAQTQYQREKLQIEQNRQRALTDARNSYNKELNLLNQKLQADLQARQRGAIAELQLISQTEQQRVSIMAQAQTALINQAKQLLGLVTGQQNAAANGGSTGKGASGGVGFGAGAYGLTGAGSRTNNINVPINIQGSNAAAIGSQVESAVYRVLAKVVSR